MFCACDLKSNEQADKSDYSILLPKVIRTDLPKGDDGRGGIITFDVNGDGKLDFIITKPGYITAHDNSGEKLWLRKIDIQLTQKSENSGLPGWHAPGIQAADMDGDHRIEILLLTRNSDLLVLEGLNGETQSRINLTVPEGAERWEHLVVTNFRGKGDRDLLLQATNANGYRMGRYIDQVGDTTDFLSVEPPGGPPEESLGTTQ